MAVIDTINLSRADGVFPGVDIDFDLIVNPIVKDYREKIRREVWTWVDSSPETDLITLEVTAKVAWIFKRTKRISITAREAAPIVERLLGPRPE